MSADDVFSVVSSVVICNQMIDIDGKEDETSSLSSNGEEDFSDEENEVLCMPYW